MSAKGERGRVKFLPNSIVSRMLFLTLLAIILSQALVASIWYTRVKQQELEGLKSTVVSLAANFAATVESFKSLPFEYRHLVLEQLRQMGGTRFFVSLNEQLIDIQPIADSEKKSLVLATLNKELKTRLDPQVIMTMEFSAPDTLHVFNNQVLLRELPKSWAHYSLTLEPLNPPILVVQIQMGDGQWLYIAALLPTPYVTLDTEVIPWQQLLFVSSLSLVLLIFVYILVRWQLRPLRQLADGADNLSRDMNSPLLPEQGARELVNTTRAFNRMHKKLQRFFEDREKLFSAISHDLKTPITRLRLRVELLDDESKITKFSKDLDELEMMVKGALQTVKETSIHENVETLDIAELIRQQSDVYNTTRQRVLFNYQHAIPYRGKPLALKRCLNNLVDNGIRYGKTLSVEVEQNEQGLGIYFRDQGPGIPEDSLQAVFNPYYRLNNDEEGHGLGLGIVRDIIQAHGGEITLRNLSPTGLEVCIALPNISLPSTVKEARE